MKKFDVPLIYRSPLITAIKNKRRQKDKMKKDFTPTLLDFGKLQLLLARHFGFCYGVENAIEIAFNTVDKHPDKRIFLLSEMIHNPQVNANLQERGVRFIMDTAGRQLIDWKELQADDIVIIPAFGTTLETEKKLEAIGIEPLNYDTTCPFVERVWNKAASIGEKDYTVIVHGKPRHEETRATFSHSKKHTPTVVIKDMDEAKQLAAYIRQEKPSADFYKEFSGQYSEGFDVNKDLQRVGVVNQTTMLAMETQAIADYIKAEMMKRYALDEQSAGERFADTRDTLCYATNDNQNAVLSLLEEDADLALVVGGYNSSNTSHLVELCEQKLPTYFINSAEKLLSPNEIRHWDFHRQKEIVTKAYLPDKYPFRIMITSGASCPDALVEGVIKKLLSFYDVTEKLELMQAEYVD